ncbi:unnamed protein product [Allacma fusca]|uniref:CTF/NF-I domain-containing protein n=1 Tax=Allacma fusca TaxID=39272 RepID=A0A8J2L0Z6_9HEXA|nr:unnamed protein product [Allacma fusca]
MVILFKAIPLESTDGERLEKSPECLHPGLCVNPYHINVSVRELDLYLANFINSHDILSGMCDNNNEKEEERGMKGYAHNPYNGVICNDTILATGVFSSKELWRLSKASIVQGPNGLQPTIKIENPSSYYCNSYTPPGPDHSVLLQSGTYSPLTLPRSLPSPQTEHRSKRRRLSSEDDPLDVGGGRDKSNEVAYYGQSPASLSSQTSWHSEVDHGSHNRNHHSSHQGNNHTSNAHHHTSNSSSNPSSSSSSHHHSHHHHHHAGHHHGHPQQKSSANSCDSLALKASRVSSNGPRDSNQCPPSPSPLGLTIRQSGLSQHSTVTTLGSSSLTGGGTGTSYYHTDSHEHHGSPAKYHENGHDTFSDFVTLVCQEAQSTGGQGGNARVSSKLSAYYSSSMLPPPPPPPAAPMARPVTIIRSTEIGGGSGLGTSPPASNTPPLTSSESNSAARESRGPLSPNSQGNDPNPSPRSSFPVSRDYSLSHLHSQSSGQLFSYSNINPVSGMSGVISPTNLSLFPPSSNSGSRNAGSRSTPLPRWNAPFISLDENIDYTMVSPLMPGPTEPNTATLIDDERYFSVVVHGSDGLDGTNGAGNQGLGSGHSGSGTNSSPPVQQQQQPATPPTPNGTPPNPPPTAQKT